MVAHLRGYTLTRVTITPGGGCGGACESSFPRPAPLRAPRAASLEFARRAVRAATAVVLGGSVAQDEAALARGYVGLDPSTGRPFPLFAAGAQDDARVAEAVAGLLYDAREARRRFLRRMRTTTQRLLTRPDNWSAVEALTRALLRRRTLRGARAAAILSRALGRPQGKARSSSSRRIRAVSPQTSRSGATSKK